MLKAIVPFYLVPERAQEELASHLKNAGIEPNLCASPKEVIREITKEGSPEETCQAFVNVPANCDSLLVGLARECNLMVIDLSAPLVKRIIQENNACNHRFMAAATPAY